METYGKSVNPIAASASTRVKDVREYDRASMKTMKLRRLEIDVHENVAINYPKDKLIYERG